MPTITNVPNGKGATAIAKVASPTTATIVKNSIDPGQGNVSVALNGPCAAGQTITSAAIVRPSGKDVVVCGLASSAGTLLVEESTDGGSTWINADSDPVQASDYVVSRSTFVGSATHYRVKFTCGPVAASKVHFTSQART